MAHTGQEIEGPGGFRLRLIKTAAETGGELLRMEASYGDAGDGPARVLWEVRPALRTAEFFERLYAGLDAAAAGGDFDFGGFLAEFSAEFRLTAA